MRALTGKEKENGPLAAAFDRSCLLPNVTKPTLYLEGFHVPLYLDFRQIALGDRQIMTFDVAPSALDQDCIEVDRISEGIQVHFNGSTGVVEWSPTKVGLLRENLLLRFQRRHRFQITLHCCCVDWAGASMVPAEMKPTLLRRNSSTVQQPLRSAVNKQQRLQHGDEKQRSIDSDIEIIPSGIFQDLKLSGEHGGNDLDRSSNILQRTKQHSFPVELHDKENQDSSLTEPSGCTEQWRYNSQKGNKNTHKISKRKIVSSSFETRGCSINHSTVPFHTQGQRLQARKLGQQEKILTEWMNFVLCPSKNAQACSNLSQEQESDEIRAKVQEIYDSAEMKAVQHAIGLEISSKRLQLRDDQDPRIDIGLRESFLELLLSYHMAWLQVGLEVMLNTRIANVRVIRTRDGEVFRIAGLNEVRKLIVSRILNDPVIQERAGQTNSKKRDSLRSVLQAHTIERFLTLVILLDRAKRMEAFPRRTPLFNATAAVKSSAEMLYSFAKDYMASEGNLARHLLGLGYGVEIQQRYLDDYNFRVTDLGCDLRDGVRLVKLVESLVSNEGGASSGKFDFLSSRLRVPAISRLQKIHNVKLVVSALQSHRLHHNHINQERNVRQPSYSASLPDGLCPNDIVNGHRGNTIRLLWIIVQHFQLHHVVSSLTGIALMQNLFRTCITRRHFLATKRAAMILQRQYRLRRILLRCRSFSPSAAIALQCAWRRIRAQRAATLVQAAFRGVLVRSQQARLRVAARIIQASMRSYLVRSRSRTLHDAAIIIQRRVRGHRAREYALKFKRRRNNSAATLISAVWKGYSVRVLRHRQDRAIIAIQTAYRSYQANCVYENIRASAIRIQALIRGWRQRHQITEEQIAAVVLQRYWRYRRARKQFSQLIEATELVQRCSRGYLARRRFQAENHAVLALQSFVRGLLLRRRLLQIKKAARIIQVSWRLHRRQRRLKTSYRGVLALQAVARGNAARHAARQRLKAILVIKKIVCSFLYRRKTSRYDIAARKMQRAWRLRRARFRWSKALRAVVHLQALVREKKARRLVRNRIAAVHRLQSAFRSMTYRRKVQQQRFASVKIQALWRGHHVRCAWAVALRGMKYLQALLRGRQARKLAREQRCALFCIQTFIRQLIFKAYRKKLAASICLQRCCRGFLHRRRLAVRTEAAVCLQSAWRSARIRNQFIRKRGVVVKVQAVLRRAKAVRDFKICLTGIRALQRRARQRSAERSLLLHRAAVSRIQNVWRVHQSRLKRRRILKAIRCLQARWRIKIAHKAVSMAQAVVRGCLVRRQSPPHVRMLRQRIHDAAVRAENDPSLRISVRHSTALEVLLVGRSCAQILRSCMTLVVSTSLARECCEALVKVEGLPKLLAVIRSCNRSKPHMELLRHVLRILENVALHPPFLNELAEAPSAVETLVELLQTYRPDDHVFVPAGRLLLRACDCESGSHARADLTHVNVQRRLQGSLRLLERKSEAEKNKSKSTHLQGSGRKLELVEAIRVLRNILKVTVPDTSRSSM